MALVVFMAVILGAHRTAGADATATLTGVWDVEHVAVDEQDQMHWGTRPDDPQLLGRELMIDADTVNFTGDKGPCKQGAWKAQVLTWAKLFAKTFSRASGGGRSTHPAPADFGLKVSPSSKVTFYQVCPFADVPPSEVWQDRRWIALRAPDLLVMHFDNQVLLTLSRRPTGAKPRASFDCQKASTPTEKTICGSHDLAGWDRSVAAAFRAALERSPGRESDLREDQKAWLKKRDSCGSKGDCIDEMLWRRVEELTQN